MPKVNACGPGLVALLTPTPTPAPTIAYHPLSPWVLLLWRPHHSMLAFMNFIYFKHITLLGFVEYNLVTALALGIRCCFCCSFKQLWEKG